jgi:hypothetical protein
MESRKVRSIMKTPNAFYLVMLLGLTGVVCSCDRTPKGWTPVFEETSTVFLETETGRISDQVAAALIHLRSDPGRAERALSDAKASLEHQRVYYLPLFQARERAYNALRYLYQADEEKVLEELGLIQETFEGMADGLGGGALLELESLAEQAAKARVAALADLEECAPSLESLARRLNLAILKGELIINSG